MVSVDGHHLWANSAVIFERIKYEKERRQWRSRRACTPTTTPSCTSVLDEAMEDQVARREMDDFKISEIQTCRMYIGGGEHDYMDHNGELWDEVSHKKLDDAEV